MSSADNRNDVYGDEAPHPDGSPSLKEEDCNPSGKETPLNCSTAGQGEAPGAGGSLNLSLSGQGKRSPRKNSTREIIGKDGKPIPTPQPNYGRVINFTEEQKRDAEAKKTSPRKRPVKVVMNNSNSPYRDTESPEPSKRPAGAVVKPTRTPVGQNQNTSIDRLSQPKRRSVVERDATLSSMKNKKRSSYGGTTVVSPHKSKELKSSGGDEMVRPPPRPSRESVTVVPPSARQPVTPSFSTPPPPQRIPPTSGSAKKGTPASGKEGVAHHVVAGTGNPPPNPQPPTEVKARRFTPKEEEPITPPPAPVSVPVSVSASPVYATKRKTNHFSPGKDEKVPNAPVEKREEQKENPIVSANNPKGTRKVFKAPPKS